MVKHVVNFKLKDPSEAMLLAVKEKLMSLPALIPQIRGMEVGLDYLGSERSYDMVLIATFDSPEALEEYRVHPEHKQVQTFIHSVREASVSVDFIF